jgi:uncharacterized protein (TIGR02001 family)
MSKLFRSLLIVGLLGVSLVGLAGAATFDGSVSYVSKYLWRGQDLNGGQPALQTSFTYYTPLNGVSVNAWGSYNLGNSTKQEVTEFDYTLTYAAAIGEDWNYYLAYDYYTYPPLTGDPAKTTELFASLTRNNVLFTPTLTYSYDIDQGKGSYVSLALKNKVQAGALPVDALLTVGYDGGQYGVTPGISDGLLTLSSTFVLNDTTLTPALNYLVVNKTMRPTAENTFCFCLTWAGSK